MKWLRDYPTPPERLTVRLRGVAWYNVIANDRILALLRAYKLSRVRDWGPAYHGESYRPLYLVHVRSTPPAGVPVEQARAFVDRMHRLGLYVAAEPQLLDGTRDGALLVHYRAAVASEAAPLRAAYLQPLQFPASDQMADWFARKVPA